MLVVIAWGFSEGRRRWLGPLLFAALALVAGCGQPPPENGESGGEQQGTKEETTAVEVGGSPELGPATDEYEEYVVEQTALLEERKEGFTGAVLAGSVEEAKDRPIKS